MGVAKLSVASAYTDANKLIMRSLSLSARRALLRAAPLPVRLTPLPMRPRKLKMSLLAAAEAEAAKNKKKNEKPGPSSRHFN